MCVCACDCVTVTKHRKVKVGYLCSIRSICCTVDWFWSTTTTTFSFVGQHVWFEPATTTDGWYTTPQQESINRRATPTPFPQNKQKKNQKYEPVSTHEKIYITPSYTTTNQFEISTSTNSQYNPSEKGKKKKDLDCRPFACRSYIIQQHPI